MHTEAIKVGDSVALVTFGKDDFACPVCQCQHGEEDWYKKYEDSDDCIIVIRCKGCKAKLGLTVTMRGGVHVWHWKSAKKVD